MGPYSMADFLFVFILRFYICVCLGACDCYFLIVVYFIVCVLSVIIPRTHVCLLVFVESVSLLMIIDY